MDEFELIERYFTRRGGAGVAIGIGDDGAVLDLPPGRQLVAVVDTLVAGVHYPPSLGAADIGWRAVAVNLSDIAAMGATPTWMTLALTLADADAAWLEDFVAGLFAAADAHGVALVGGDTTRGGETVASVQLLGHVDPARVLTRRGCRPGDRIYLSGSTGDAAAGLESLLRGDDEPALAARFRRPEPRLALGSAAAGIASAAIDVSDGLAADLGHVLSASGCGATIDVDELPLSPALVAYAGRDRAIDLALAGGDDYELCLSVPAGAEAAFRDAARGAGVPVTAIGSATAEPGLRLERDGRDLGRAPRGYRHFAAPGDGP